MVLQTCYKISHLNLLFPFCLYGKIQNFKPLTTWVRIYSKEVFKTERLASSIYDCITIFMIIVLVNISSSVSIIISLCSLLSFN